MHPKHAFFTSDNRWRSHEAADGHWILSHGSSIGIPHDVGVLVLLVLALISFVLRLGIEAGTGAFAAAILLSVSYRVLRFPFKVEVWQDNVILYYRYFPHLVHARVFERTVVRSIVARPQWSKDRGSYICSAEVYIRLQSERWWLVYRKLRGTVPQAYLDSRTLAQTIAKKSGFPFEYIAPDKEEFLCSACKAPVVFGESHCSKCGEVLEYN